MILQDVMNKLSSGFKKVGQKTVYTVLLMWYAFRKKETPAWAKNVILGSLAYFLSPIDAIPDLTPFLGFTDDFGVLSFGLVTIACYVDEEVKVKALEHLQRFFPSTDDSALADIDDML